MNMRKSRCVIHAAGVIICTDCLPMLHRSSMIGAPLNGDHWKVASSTGDNEFHGRPISHTIRLTAAPSPCFLFER